MPAAIFEAMVAEAKESSKDLGFTTFADRAARKVIHAAKVARLLPEGKYRVLYVDPPWRYSDSGLDDYGHAERHYPTMNIQELCDLPVRGLADEDAALFLWVTSPMLEESFKLINAWSFPYKTSFVWDKVRHNYGHYNSVRHEFLLVAVRGSCIPEVPKLYDSVVTIERSETHSEKPEEFRKMIETRYPSGKRIELFSRNQGEGWSAWENDCRANEDFGLEQVTGNPADRYMFRTAPLRNAAVMPAFMHNGAFVRLEDAISHHLDPYTSARDYVGSALPADLQVPPGPIEPVLSRLDPLLQTPTVLSEEEFSDLVDFVKYGLLDPRILPEHLKTLVPKRVPSDSPTLTFEFVKAH